MNQSTVEKVIINLPNTILSPVQRAGRGIGQFAGNLVRSVVGVPIIIGIGLYEGITGKECKKKQKVCPTCESAIPSD